MLFWILFGPLTLLLGLDAIGCRCNKNDCIENQFQCTSNIFCYSKLQRATVLQVRATDDPEGRVYEQEFYTSEVGCVSDEMLAREDENFLTRCIQSTNEAKLNRTLEKVANLDPDVKEQPVVLCCRSDMCNHEKKYRHSFTKDRAKEYEPGSIQDVFYMNIYTFGAMVLSITVTSLILLQLGILLGRRLSLKKFNEMTQMSNSNTTDQRCLYDDKKFNLSLNQRTNSFLSCNSKHESSTDQIFLSNCLPVYGNNQNSIRSDLSSEPTITVLNGQSNISSNNNLKGDNQHFAQLNLTPNVNFNRTFCQINHQPFSSPQLKNQHYYKLTDSSNDPFMTNIARDHIQPYAEGNFNYINSNEYMDPNYSFSPVGKLPTPVVSRSCNNQPAQ